MSLLQRETRALDPSNGSYSKPTSCSALKIVIHTSLIFFFSFSSLTTTLQIRYYFLHFVS